MAQKDKIDVNAKNDEKKTGFIMACENKHSEVIDLIIEKAESFQIDLQCKDDGNKSGFDYFPEHFLNLLEKAILNKDFDKAFLIKKEFIHDFLFNAIERDEEMAIAMIDSSQRLNLSLSERNERNRTPLNLACRSFRPKIAKAIMCQAKVQDIAINYNTAFINACDNGLTLIVAMMLEMAQELKIDLNAKDDLKRTGFICACKFKHSEIIDLIMAKADSLQIDLQCKDEDDKSGFDYFPEHFKK